MNIQDEYLLVMDKEYNKELHGEFEGEFEKEYFKSKFKWDHFQIHAFQAIKRGDNILVVAPTSSGKTSVAKYGAIYNLIKNKVRVIYTTPIKTLSNEKYEEMKTVLEPFGIIPGLLTGDQKINEDSQFLIMTAEILSNALFRVKNDDVKDQYSIDKNFVDSIGCVIIDEIHFISDKSRGQVWENTLILLDPKIQIIGLSATIDKPEKFGSWIGRIKKKNITLVKKYDRPVPLEYSIFDGEKLNIIMDIHNKYNSTKFHEALKNLKDLDKKSQVNKTNKVYGMLNEFIKYAKFKDLLQLCFIIFSKKNCEKFANSVEINLVTGKESALAVRELESKLGSHLKYNENMPIYRQIKTLISKGVCYHHAGVPVILKEVIEHLYKTGHIKVIFATETIAVGVNMPIRTLVLSSVEKNDGTVIRSLNAAEFKQICGRAGRRGLDNKGSVVFLPLYNDLNENHVRSELLFGPMPKIESNLELNYHTFLKILQSDITDENIFFDNSLLSIKNNNVISGLKIQIDTKKKEIDALYEKYNKYISDNNVNSKIVSDIKEYIKLELKIKNNNMNGMKIKYQKEEKRLKKLEYNKNKNITLFDMLKNIEKYHTYIGELNNDILYYKSYKAKHYEKVIKFLKFMEYLDYDMTLTKYGEMATQVNECNPFILVEIFTSGCLENMSAKQIISLISTLTDPISSSLKVDKSLHMINTDKDVIYAIEYLDSRIQEYIHTEKSHEVNLQSEINYWELSLDYIELVDLWVNTNLDKEDHTRILQELNKINEYEGSFIKNILKINNIIGNLISLCNITKNMDLLPVLQEIEPLLLKGMVNADSLHVIS